MFGKGLLQANTINERHPAFRGNLANRIGHGREAAQRADILVAGKLVSRLGVGVTAEVVEGVPAKEVQLGMPIVEPHERVAVG